MGTNPDSRARRTPVVDVLLRPDRLTSVVTDVELVLDLAAGDDNALATLYDRYGTPCWSLAKRILRDDELAKEVVQEVFLALWRNPRAYDPSRGGFSTWLLSMTHHKAVDLVRREDGHRRRAAAVAIDADATVTIDDAVTDGLRATRVRRALSALPEPQREVLVLAYFGGYTQPEIAARTGAPLGTVKTRTLLAMRRLRTALADEAADAAPEVAG